MLVIIICIGAVIGTTLIVTMAVIIYKCKLFYHSLTVQYFTF